GHPLLGLEGLDPVDESRARHPYPHGLGIVALRAGDRVLDERQPLVVLHVASRLIGHAGHDLESLHDVALAHEAIESEVRGVALNAGAWLPLLGHPPGLLLIEEGEGVATAVAGGGGEGVAGEDGLGPRLAVELLRGGALLPG